MATYAVGDIQGCYDSLQELLEKLDFSFTKDRLWLAGDLVNRGPKSLKTLRFVMANQNCMRVVLGNHDLHLLKLSVQKEARIPPALKKILAAKDCDDIMTWLRHQPLMHYNAKLDTAMVHAGILPGWDVKTALKRAAEVEHALTNKGYRQFLRNMPGNEPNRWNGKLKGNKRLRFIVNAFTRMRMVYPDGRLELRYSGPPAKAKTPLVPWYKIRKRAAADSRIVFGHWSSLGYLKTRSLICLDTGCVWGRRLTAIRLDKKSKAVSVRCNCE